MSLGVRFPAVAGMFYPESATILSHEVEELLAAASSERQLQPKAIIVPHAGYIYSGPIAASIYARLSALHNVIRRVVLLGPTHRVAVDGLALPACEAFATPLGQVAIDQEAIAGIMDLPQVVVSNAAHAQEHSLEVQLPFLQMLLDDFRLIPLAVGRASSEEIGEVIERLWGGEETLIVVSSDLSHFLPYDKAILCDAQTAKNIMQLAPSITHHQACGASPINGLLQVARKRHLQAQLIDLRNSGDTAGDKLRVVGYAAFAFLEQEHHAH